jgi:hypothetical protein
MPEATLPHEAGHEVRDPQIRPFALGMVGLVVALALIFALVYEGFRFLNTHSGSQISTNPMASGEPTMPPAPRLEVHPAAEMQALRDQENQILSTYGWVNKKSGAVRIPIDRAIDLQLQKGFPTRKGGSLP